MQATPPQGRIRAKQSLIEDENSAGAPATTVRIMLLVRLHFIKSINVRDEVVNIIIHFMVLLPLFHLDSTIFCSLKIPQRMIVYHCV